MIDVYKPDLIYRVRTNTDFVSKDRAIVTIFGTLVGLVILTRFADDPDPVVLFMTTVIAAILSYITLWILSVLLFSRVGLVEESKK